MFQQFGSKLPILGWMFTVLWVSGGLDFIFSFSDPSKGGTSLCDSASYQPLSVTIHQGVWPLREPAKKEFSKHYVSYVCSKVSRERIVTKFGRWSHLAQLVNFAKFCSSRFIVSYSAGGGISTLAIDLRCRHLHNAVLSCCLWWRLMELDRGRPGRMMSRRTWNVWVHPDRKYSFGIVGEGKSKGTTG